MGRILFLSVLFLSALPLLAQSTPGRCKSAPEYQQFDFWVGDWEVRDAKGVLQGKNLVTKEHDGCVVLEHWDSGDQTGTSPNMYDFRTKKWYEAWFDSFGNMLIMSGGLEGKSMVMQGERRTPEGQTALERTSWTPLDDGRVRQVWDYSMDDGKTWKVRFEGFDSKKG